MSSFDLRGARFSCRTSWHPAKAPHEAFERDCEAGAKTYADHLDHGIVQPAVADRLQCLKPFESERRDDDSAEYEQALPGVGETQQAACDEMGEESLAIGAKPRHVRAQLDRRQGGEDDHEQGRPTQDESCAAEFFEEDVQGRSPIVGAEAGYWLRMLRTVAG